MNLDRIAERAERYTGRANRAAINKAFRAADESHLWPINNRFDATERAIRAVRRDRARHPRGPALNTPTRLMLNCLGLSMERSSCRTSKGARPPVGRF